MIETIKEILNKKIENMTLKEIDLVYLEWLNEFLTIDCFCHYYNVSLVKTYKIINIAKVLRELN